MPYLLHAAGGDEDARVTLGRTNMILDNLSAGIRNDEKGSGPLTRTRNRKYHEFLEGRGA